VNLALRIYDAFNRRDLDAVLALTHEDVEVESRLVVMEGGYHGPEGVRRWWNDFLGVLPDYTVQVEGIRDLGDVTVAQLSGRGHGAGSQTPVVETFWQPVRWRDGKCVWWRNFMTEAEALEAAGLRKLGGE
jgi:ketosteroid isomerase-like protein